jgi:hypothetical protein
VGVRCSVFGVATSRSEDRTPNTFSSHCLPPAESKEKRKMKWPKPRRDRDRDLAPKAAPEEKVPKDTLRIEELEERIAPNATWGD